MKQSTFPLELLLGMKYYASDAEGIGGNSAQLLKILSSKKYRYRKKAEQPVLISSADLPKQTGSSSMQSKKLQNVSPSVTGGLGGRAPKIATPSPGS